MVSVHTIENYIALYVNSLLNILVTMENRAILEYVHFCRNYKLAAYIYAAYKLDAYKVDALHFRRVQTRRMFKKFCTFSTHFFKLMSVYILSDRICASIV